MKIPPNVRMWGAGIMSLYFLFMAIMNAVDATRTLDWIKACGGLCAAFLFAAFAREGYQRQPKTGPSPTKI
jgi:hypothetical protein